jgi:hypothetical protein
VSARAVVEGIPNILNNGHTSWQHQRNQNLFVVRSSW